MMGTRILTVGQRWTGLALVFMLLAGSVTATLAASGSAVPYTRLTQGAYPQLDSPDPDQRAAAVQAIRQAQDVRAVPLLIEHLDDPDQRVGLYIAQTLIAIAPESALPVIRNAAWLADTDGRWRAALILGERRDVRAIAVLTYNLRHEDVLVHRTAADSLAKIATPAAARTLIRALRSERPSEVNAAMRGLLALGDVAVPFLRTELEAGHPVGELRATLVLEMLGAPLRVGLESSDARGLATQI